MTLLRTIFTIFRTQSKVYTGTAHRQRFTSSQCIVKIHKLKYWVRHLLLWFLAASYMTVAMHLIQKYLVRFMQSHSTTKASLIYYFSAGVASQYKRLNFLNLCCQSFNDQIMTPWLDKYIILNPYICNIVQLNTRYLVKNVNFQIPVFPGH